MARVFSLGRDQHDVPVDVVQVLDNRARERSLPMVLIGAAARDLCVHAPLGERPPRATHDVDIAVAVPRGEALAEFLSVFERARRVHTVVIHGVEVDVVPFGGVERDGRVAFGDGSVLDVVGLAEAMRGPDVVDLAEGVTVKVASIEMQAALKVLAWRDRHVQNAKDAVDLHEILAAGSRGPYEEEAWGDLAALEACDYVLDLAGAYRLGALSRRAFTAARARAVAGVLDDPVVFARLGTQMSHLSSGELLDAYARGFRRGAHPLT